MTRRDEEPNLSGQELVGLTLACGSLVPRRRFQFSDGSDTEYQTNFRVAKNEVTD